MDAEKDSTGVIWGITLDEIVRWEKNQWVGAPLMESNAPDFPTGVFPGPGGAVLILTNSSNNEHEISIRRGAEGKVLARFSGALRNPEVSVDLAGNIWITDGSPVIRRVTKDGGVEAAYTLTPEQFRAVGRPRVPNAVYNPIRTAVDGKGRTWFWTDSLTPSFRNPSVEGVLIYDGSGFSHHTQIEGLPDKIFCLVAKRDEGSMWVGVEDEGLYEVNIVTLKATRVQEPTPGAFGYVQQVFKAGDKWHVVTGKVWPAVSDRANEERSGTLWRQETGGWEKVVDGLDSRAETQRLGTRPWIEMEDGLWLGAFGSGPWFIPNANAGRENQKPKLVDWRNRFPLNDTLRLFKLADDTLLSVSLPDGSAVWKPGELLAAWKPTTRAEVLHTFAHMTKDAKGNMWMLDPRLEETLSKWDGEKWMDHSIPMKISSGSVNQLVLDSLQRIWLIPSPLTAPVAIYDPANGTWSSFVSYTAGLQAQVSTGVRLLMDPLGPQTPSFTSDGRICFGNRGQGVTYFDGISWQTWRPNQIKTDGRTLFDGPPFFDKAGNVAVDVSGETWEYTTEKNWHKTSYEHGPGEYRNNPQIAIDSDVTPPACVTGNVNSLIRGSDGFIWFTAGGKLFKSLGGLCAEQFGPDESQPFVDSRRILQAYTDNHGTAFFVTARSTNRQAAQELVIVKRASRPPKTEMRVVRESKDSVRLEFSAKPQGEVNFLWRLDSGPWTALVRERTARLEWLPSGKHTIQAAAINDRLEMDPDPAESTFEVRIEPKTQIAGMIAALGANEAARRESAIRALALQPDLALPALRAAEEKSQGDARWWIEAAIQEIERAQASVVAKLQSN